MSAARALAAGLVALALVAVPLLGGAQNAEAAPTWQRIPMPIPPGGLYRTPLGLPGDLKFWSPNRGLMTVGGNNSVPEGIYYWDGVEWRQLATVCGGGEDARIAWAGPTEFWVIARPSLPRAQFTGLALCHFKDGAVVGSYSTPPSAIDPYHRMLAATCVSVNDCWFGGVGERDGTGQRIGAFHLHWDGAALRSVYGPQGRAVSDLLVHGGELFESTFVGRAPLDRTTPPELAAPEDAPRLLHRITGESFTNDTFVPAGAFANGQTEIRALDSNGQQAWAVGGGAVSGTALTDAFANRPPFAARLVNGAWTELTLTGTGVTDDTIALGDVASIPGTDTAWGAVRESGAIRQEEGEAGQPKLVKIGATGASVLATLEADTAATKGAAWKVACPAANDCWLATALGYLYRWYDPAAPPSYPPDAEPAFQGLITVRPNEAAEQPIPDDPPEDTSQLNAPPVETPRDQRDENLPACKRPRALLYQISAKVRGRNRLVVRFRIRRPARIGLVGRRGKKVVARAKLRPMRPGRRSLSLKVRAERWPTGLRFVVKGDKPKRQRCRAGGGDSDTVTVPSSAAARG